MADEPPATPDAGEADRGDRVLVAFAGSDPVSQAVPDALRELVARLGLQLQTTRADAPPWLADGADAGAPSSERARARVWIDARPRDRVDVTISTARGRSFDPPVSRTVSRADATDAIVVERVAHVVHATLESLLSPPEPEKAQPPTPAPAAAEHAAPAARDAARAGRTGFGLDAAAFGIGSGVASSSGALFGGGASLDLLLRQPFLSPTLWLGAGLLQSFDTQGQRLVLETSVSSLRAVPGVELVDLSALDLDLGVGIGIDLFHTIPRDGTPSTVVLGDPKTLADPVLEALLVSRIRLARGARLLVGVVLDYDFGGHRYTSVDRFETSSVVLQPWTLRPSAMLGLCIPILGPGACSSPE
jgi:hypothetical protein